MNVVMEASRTSARWHRSEGSVTSAPPFEELIDRHGASVMRLCRAALPESEADDVWQETFLAALRAYPDLDTNANYEAWLVTIAHRKTIDAHRGRGRRATPASDHLDNESVDDPDGADRIVLREAIGHLGDAQRTAVLLHHVAGLPHQQVAQITGQSPAAARRASSDGIAALRRHLDPEAS